MTTAVLESTFSTGLLPMYSAPISCSTGISSGKLKGVMSATGPKGKRYPLETCPSWSPGTPKERDRKRTLSPLKLSRNWALQREG